MQKSLSSKKSSNIFSPLVYTEKTLFELGLRPKDSSYNDDTIHDYLSKVTKLIQNFKQTDVSIQIGTDLFECHMDVLKCYSEYFVFLDADDNNSNEVIELSETDVTPKAFAIIYDWMLSDDNCVPRELFPEIFKAALFLKVKELEQNCFRYMDLKLEERSGLQLYLEAKYVNLPILQKQMSQTISKIFLTFAASIEFLNLSFDEVEAILTSNKIAVNSELDVLFVAIKWLHHEWPKRQSYVTELIQHVRFSMIVAWQLVELKKYPTEFKHIFMIPEVQGLIDDALNFVNTKNKHIDENIFINYKYLNQHKQLHRQIIMNDSNWQRYKFNTNPDIFQNYLNFCKYLNEIDNNHWKKVKLKSSTINRIIDC